MPEGYYYVPQPIRNDGAGGVDKGPRDIMRDLENPDMLVPPVTDAGLLPNLKFSFSDTHMTLNNGGGLEKLLCEICQSPQRWQVSI